jgi:hypothetical protein
MSEVTRADEQVMRCPLLSGCMRDKCEWWLELPLLLGSNGEYRYVRGCAVRLFPMILHAALNAREER